MGQQEQRSKDPVRKVPTRSVRVLPDKLATEFLDNHSVDLPDPLRASMAVVGEADRKRIMVDSCSSISQRLAQRRNNALRTVRHSVEQFKAQQITRTPDLLERSGPLLHENFEDILQVLDRAKSNYSGQRGILEALSNLSESLGCNGKALKAWLDLLPDGEYTSIICGSFKLIISAAARASNVRATVFDALARIPKAVQRARRLKELYGTEFEAEEYSIFYCSVLEACEAMLAFLSKTSLRDKIRRAGSALARQSDYKEKLVSKIDAVDRAAEDVDREATVRFQENFQKHSTSNAADFDRLFGEVHAGRVVLNGVASALWSLLEARERSVNMSQHTQQSPATNQVSLQHLQQYLHDAVEPHGGDRRTVLEQAAALEPAIHARCELVLRSSEIYQWMLTSEARFLVVEANAGTASMITPISYACALLAETLGSRKRGVIALSAFCGLHLDFDSPNSGVEQMIIQLIWQLLENFPTQSVCDLPDSKTIQGLQRETKDLSSLVNTFKSVLRQLTGNVTVFCIVDGLDWYEDNYQEAEVRKTMAMFQRLVTQDDIVCPLKILLTATTRFREEARSLLTDEQLLWLPEHAVPEQHGWNSQDWQSSTQGLLRQASLPQEQSG